VILKHLLEVTDGLVERGGHGSRFQAISLSETIVAIIIPFGGQLGYRMGTAIPEKFFSKFRIERIFMRKP